MLCSTQTTRINVARHKTDPLLYPQHVLLITTSQRTPALTCFITVPRNTLEELLKLFFYAKRVIKSFTALSNCENIKVGNMAQRGSRAQSFYGTNVMGDVYDRRATNEKQFLVDSEMENVTDRLFNFSKDRLGPKFCLEKIDVSLTASNVLLSWR